MNNSLSFATHIVKNQVKPLSDYNLYSVDHGLYEGVQRYGAHWANAELTELGHILGTEEVIQWGYLVNAFTPVLNTHDTMGHRIDRVEFHFAWHDLMALAVRFGVHHAPWADPKSGAHLARAAKMMLIHQNEPGHCCPISMTYAVRPALQAEPKLVSQLAPLLDSQQYDPSIRPVSQKQGMIMGMGMTEKQGGSDVRANATTAVAENRTGSGEIYRLTGHKWFCSAPQSDAFLVLAKTTAGIGCFYLPRFSPDGQLNQFYIQRLKNKLGNRSNASGEVEFNNAYGILVGEEGRGVPTIIEMVNHTRLDCVIGATALMRQALTQALHYCRSRMAFGKLLIDQPLMQNVLADLAIESEAATALMLRIASSYDHAPHDDNERRFKRIATAIAKYYLCKRSPVFIAEALECLGGNGYVEESMMPRLFRESPLNSIWEGSGNVICLDVIRALKQDPKTIECVFQEIKQAAGHKIIQKNLEQLQVMLRASDDLDYQARYIVERLAILLQASLLERFAPSQVSEAFIGARLMSDEHTLSKTFGTLARSTDFSAILNRAQGL